MRSEVQPDRSRQNPADTQFGFAHLGGQSALGRRSELTSVRYSKAPQESRVSYGAGRSHHEAACAVQRNPRKGAGREHGPPRVADCSARLVPGAPS